MAVMEKMEEHPHFFVPYKPTDRIPVGSVWKSLEFDRINFQVWICRGQEKKTYKFDFFRPLAHSVFEKMKLGINQQKADAGSQVQMFMTV